ncbi:EAL domain-containing protein [Cetobacterium sp.]|uniref:EAL domain-containing protein n=1 Tax=Cetobacterium sp. TaxID=2071632 RepID=UPI003EE4C906
MRIFLFVIISSLIFAQEAYIPKSKQEEIILEKYRKKNLILILDNKNYKNEVINMISLNNLILELFEKYLNLNVEVKIEDLSKIKKINNNDILGGVFESTKSLNNILFSVPIYNEDLYLITKNSEEKSNKKYNNIIENNEIYKEFFENYKINTLNLKKEELENINLLKYNLLTSNEAINYINKRKIATLPNVVIGISINDKELLGIINNSIKEKYEDLINTFLSERKIKIQKNIFFNSLSMNEKEFIEKNKTIPVGIEFEQKWSYYLKDKKEYIGSFPNLLKRFSNLSGLNFEVINSVENSWEDILILFNTRKIRMIPMVKTKNREKNYIFSRNLREVTLYEIQKRNKSISNSKYLVGVIKNSLEEDYAKRYFNKNSIKVFNNYDLLIKGLEDESIKSAYTLNSNNLITDYSIVEKEKFLMRFAFHKDDVILRDIIDEEIKFIDDLDTLMEEGIENKKDILYEERLSRKEQIIKKNIFIIILLFLIIMAVLKIYYQIQRSKKLLVDNLTNFPNYFKYLDEIDKYNLKNGYGIKIKLNMLKNINQSLGWKIGNDIIIEISELILLCLNQYKKKYSVYKISDDKFYIFIELENIDLLINDIKNKILSLKLDEKCDRKSQIRINLLKKDKGDKTKKIFEYLEIVTNNDENDTEVLIMEINDEMIKKIERKNKIKSLIVNKKFEGIYPVFQPKIDLKTNKIIGAETLARWETKELGFISPGEFVPIFEEMGKIHIIDYLMAKETLKFIKVNNLKFKKIKISFNTSLQTFERKDFILTINNLLEKYNVTGNMIEIELTESILALNLTTIIEKIKILKIKNIQISIDDFTAGNSSVALLTILPIDVIKFDKSILDLVTENNKSAQNIYYNLSKMIKELNLKIVSEGIETKYQLEFLRKNNIDIGQGFIFSKPLKRDQFLKYIEEESIHY